MQVVQEVGSRQGVREKDLLHKDSIQIFLFHFM